jgi:cysteine-rich repeat protein
MQASLTLAIAGFGLASFFGTAARSDSESHRDGAPITTTVDGARVVDNTHAARSDVYLAASPDDHAAMTSADDYYFAVTDPGGTHILSSDDASCRKIRISGDGVIVEVYRAPGCEHARGVDHDHSKFAAITVQLMPFDVTPDPSGEYSVWIIPEADYDGSFAHTAARYDRFKVISTTPPVCGNGTVEPGEQCDDGNTTSGDGCSATCTVETLPPDCDDWFLGEECNDDDAATRDRCSTACRLDLRITTYERAARRHRDSR